MLHLPWLEDRNYKFPDVDTALTEPDGLLAASVHLSPELVIDAYAQGIFPWYSEGQPVLWWSPDPRCVFYPEKFHVSRSFRRTLNSRIFDIRIDSAFRDVMLACAAPRRRSVDSDTADVDEPGTWITDAMVDVYCQLHDVGIAHSIECWHNDVLVGGMYGLTLGDMFFGESMFSNMKDASKAAIHHLSTELKPSLIDAQVSSRHLHTLGAELISRRQFIEHIRSHLHYSINI